MAGPSLSSRLNGQDQTVIESIRSHLGKMLNTRQGHALVAPDYGMPDLTAFGHNVPASDEVLRRAILKSIKKYEPRLAAVEVKLVPREKHERCLRFQITATLNGGAANAFVRFETAVEGSGRILVTG
jgi:type VI secretion system protein